MPRRVNKLSDLKIDEVSLVDQPANDHAEVLLSKRDETDPDGGSVADGTGEASKAHPDGSSVHVPATDEEGEKKSEKGDQTEYRDEGEEDTDETEKGFFSGLVDKVLGREEVSKPGMGMGLPMGMQQQGQPAPGPQGQMPGQPGMGGAQAFPSQGMQQPGQMQAGQPPIPDEVVQYIRALEQQVAEQQGQGQQGQKQPSGQEEPSVSGGNPFGKREDDLTDEEQSFLSELAKSLEGEDTQQAVAKAQELVKQANQRAEQAEEIAKAERDHRLNEEYVAKAKSYVGLPVDPTEFGPVLKRLHETMPEADVTVIEKALSAANETIASGGFFSEIGKNAPGTTTPVSKIEQRADEIVTKNEDMSREAAVAKALEENPSLYDEYLRENSTSQ